MRQEVRNALVLEANEALRGGNATLAFETCERVLQVFPSDFEACLLSGVAAARLGDGLLAVERLRRALEIHPQSADAMKWLASVLRTQGALEGAAQFGRRAAALQPSDPDIRANLGHCLVELGLAQEAIGHLAQAVQLRPKVGAIHFLLGTAFEAIGEDSGALKAYRNAAALSPDVPDGFVAAGKLLLAHGEPEKAVAEFLTALRLGADTADIHVALAQALIALDREIEAQTHLERAIELEPGAGDTYAMLAYRLQTRGRFAEARENFRKSIDLKPEQAVAYYGITQGLRISAADAALVAQMDEIAAGGRLGPQDQMHLLFALGKALGDLGEYGRAMKTFEEANRLAFQVCLGGRPFQRERYSAIIDATISRFTKAYFDDHRALGSASRQPIFIVGMMRSGTTLLDQIVSSHPAVSAMGERDFWLRQRIDMTNVEDAARTQTAYLDMQRTGAGLKPHVTDKTPQNFQMLGLIYLLFPEAPIIHVRRHPADNCLSIFTTPYDVSPDFAHDAGSIAFAYREYLRLMAHWREVLPASRFFELDYEDLVTRHELVVRETIAFCGLEWDDACLQHENNDNVVKTPSLWQVRQPIYGSSIGRWRRYEPWLGELAWPA